MDETANTNQAQEAVALEAVAQEDEFKCGVALHKTWTWQAGQHSGKLHKEGSPHEVRPWL